MNSVSSLSTCEPGVKYLPPGLAIPVKYRRDYAQILQYNRLTDGAEVGVGRGDFAAMMRANCPACRTYHLVDVWTQQDKYADFFNVDNGQQEATYQAALNLLKPWENKTVVHRMYSAEASKLIPNHSLDWVYIDARHDYCSVSQGLLSYWPKLRPGGLLTEHDYVSNGDVYPQDWSLCADGITRNPKSRHGCCPGFCEKTRWAYYQYHVF